MQRAEYGRIIGYSFTKVLNHGRNRVKGDRTVLSPYSQAARSRIGWDRRRDVEVGRSGGGSGEWVDHSVKNAQGAHAEIHPGVPEAAVLAHEPVADMAHSTPAAIAAQQGVVWPARKPEAGSSMGLRDWP